MHQPINVKQESRIANSATTELTFRWVHIYYVVAREPAN